MVLDSFRRTGQSRRSDRWFLEVLGSFRGSRRSGRVGPKRTPIGWFIVVYGGLGWFCVVCMGSTKWFRVQRSLWYFTVVRRGSGWINVV